MSLMNPLSRMRGGVIKNKVILTNPDGKKFVGHFVSLDVTSDHLGRFQQDATLEIRGHYQPHQKGAVEVLFETGQKFSGYVHRIDSQVAGGSVGGVKSTIKMIVADGNPVPDSERVVDIKLNERSCICGNPSGGTHQKWCDLRLKKSASI